MRNKLTRQLDAFGAGDAVAGVESTLESPRTLDSSGAALLADVRAMEGCAPTPRAHRAHGSVGPTIGTARTPGSASSLGRQSVPTPGSGVRLGDVKGNGTSWSCSGTSRNTFRTAKPSRVCRFEATMSIARPSRRRHSPGSGLGRT